MRVIYPWSTRVRLGDDEDTYPSPTSVTLANCEGNIPILHTLLLCFGSIIWMKFFSISIVSYRSTLVWFTYIVSVRLTQHVIGEFSFIFAFWFLFFLLCSFCYFLDATDTCQSSQSRWDQLRVFAAFGSFLAAKMLAKLPPTTTYAQWVGNISTKHGQLFEIKQLRSRFQRFRKAYMIFTSIKNDSGLG